MRRVAKLSACCALALSPAAFGQEAAPPADARQSPTELDTIVVTVDRALTGTKTDTKLIETPQSISVVAAEQIAERTALNFQDVFRYSAGVATESQGLDVRGDFFSARGFATVQYLDGLNRMPDFVYGARLEPFTLERAEVLRGPSSVLYGAGGAGGLFNAASKRPQQAFAGEVGVVVGNYGLRQVQVDVTGGLTDSLAGRVVALGRDGELQWDTQANDRTLVNPSLSWTGQDTTVTLIGLYQKDRIGVMSYALLPEQMDAKGLDYSSFWGDTDFNRMNTDYTSATLLVDHAFSDRVRFGSRTRYFDQRVDYRELYIDVGDSWESVFLDPAQTLLSREFYVHDGSYKGYSTDNSVAFDFDTGPLRHKVLVGLDYTDFRRSTREGYSCDWAEGYCWGEAGSMPGSGSPPPLDLKDPNHRVDFSYGYLPWPETNVRADSTSLGYYLQDQVRIADRVSALLGVRRDKVDTTVNGFKVLDGQTSTTYRVGVIGEVGAGFSPYVSYAESFLPIVDVDVYGDPYKPREGRQYEAGVKWQPNSSTLVTLSAFDIEETNHMVQDPDNLQNFIQVGSVGSKGYELEAAVQFKGLEINAAWSYTDARVQEASDGTTGLRVGAVPQHLASLWLSRSFWLGDDLRLRIGAGARYTGDKYDTYMLYETAPVTLFDAVASLEYGDWSLALNGSNITGKDYMAHCTLYQPQLNQGGCYAGAPRIVTATVRYRF
ncbi:TonB-dependent siderophore receptor [Pseudoxanthomonas broegbernensis]|nr:TonB-dependent siderophore receptor [Pseudoxanthomonas broegbernensis]MBB6063526.1 iron complex outermembrane receptor protein [Pseudoxanthomonas broegbernensis]